MKSNLDPGILYRSPDGYEKVIAHYDQTLISFGIPYQSQYIETSFGQIHLVVCGKREGKPVVLWHGQNANAATWSDGYLN